MPEVVVTDGSNLDPTTLAEVGPDARHRPGVSRVLEGLPKNVLDAVRRLRRSPSRRADRGRGREPGRHPEGRPKRRGLTNEEGSAFVFKHRRPIVRRRDQMSDQERAGPATMLSYLPESPASRDPVDRPGRPLEAGRGEAPAWGRHAAPVADRSSLAVPGSAPAVAAPAAEKCAKMIAFLKGPARRRVRTNNHVGRVDRKLRHEEEARYKRRGRGTTVRSLVRPRDRCWRQGRASRDRGREGSWPTARDRSSPKAVAADRVA